MEHDTRQINQLKLNVRTKKTFWLINKTLLWFKDKIKVWFLKSLLHNLLRLILVLKKKSNLKWVIKVFKYNCLLWIIITNV